MTPEWFAKALRDFHPLRVQYWALSDKNPWLWRCRTSPRSWRRTASRARANAWLPAEQLVSNAAVAALDLYRDLRDATAEALFFEVYGNMLSLQMADEREEIRRARAIRSALDPRGARGARHVEEGSAGRGPRAHRAADRKAGSGRRKLSPMQRTRELVARRALIATSRRTSAAGCCRRRRSSSSSSRSARSARCRSSCARRRTVATRTRCSTGWSTTSARRAAARARRRAARAAAAARRGRETRTAEGRFHSPAAGPAPAQEAHSARRRNGKAP